MRQFQDMSAPRTLRITCAFLVKALALLFFVWPVTAIATDELRSTLPPGAPEVEAVRTAEQAEQRLKKERERTLREFQALSETIELSSEKREALEAAVQAIESDTAKLRNEAVRAAEFRDRLAAEIEVSNDRLALLGVREADLKESLASRRDVLAEVLAALQRMGRNPPPALLVTPDDAVASIRSALVLGTLVPGLRHEAERMVADLTVLARLRSDTEAERALLRARMIDAAEGEERLLLLSQAKREMLERTGRDLDAERRRAAELANEAGTLEELTERLDADLQDAAKARTLAERKADEAAQAAMVAAADALRRAREEAALAKLAPLPEAPDLMEPPEFGSTTPAAFAGADPERTKPAFAFDSLKAKLALPVSGVIERAFGAKAARGVRNNGLVVAARPNALVRAPTDGWVLYVGPFRSYGEIVILNVGADYRMVLAGLDSADVALGQFVLAGEPIGRLGKVKLASAASIDVASTRPTLYVELREGERRIDPGEWFATNVTTAEREANG